MLPLCPKSPGSLAAMSQSTSFPFPSSDQEPQSSLKEGQGASKSLLSRCPAAACSSYWETLPSTKWTAAWGCSPLTMVAGRPLGCQENTEPTFLRKVSLNLFESRESLNRKTSEPGFRPGVPISAMPTSVPSLSRR